MFALTPGMDPAASGFALAEGQKVDEDAALKAACSGIERGYTPAEQDRGLQLLGIATCDAFDAIEAHFLSAKLPVPTEVARSVCGEG